jgi:signal transduction histidine kinase
MKYSRADVAQLSLRHAGDRLELTVQDNGRGFLVQETLAGRGEERGLGLTSMQERARLSGGALSIESIPGEGTTIRASWPLSHEQ